MVAGHGLTLCLAGGGEVTGEGGSREFELLPK